MKLFSLFTFLFSLTAQAAETPIFRIDSPVPSELQARITALVGTKCRGAVFGLREESTVVTEKRVDQERDFYYRTFLKGSYLFDGMHPVGVDIIVDSAEYAISNPSIDRYEILSVQAPEDICR